jgi:nucleotide-binding universal stress UspA family protein
MTQMTHDDTVRSSTVVGGPPTVVVAVDETEHSVRVATVARDFFGPDARFLVVSVGAKELLLWDGHPLTWGVSYPVVPSIAGVDYPFVPATTGDDPELPTAGLTAVDVAQRNAEGVARAAELHDAEPIGDVGDPAECILTVAEEHGADVIVVGSHHRSWLSRLFTGSVSGQVIKHADRPVLVVP